MSWRLAHGLEKLRLQVNAGWPHRSKDSDGSVGDARHQAEKSSDHNPWISDPPGPNVVSAVDITHDPVNGFDSYAFADMLMRNKDTRIKYLISNRRIGSGDAGPSAWVWRKYTGSNAHDHHVHISLKSDKAHYDSIKEWNLEGMISPPSPEVVAAHIPPPPTLRKGDHGASVSSMQTDLNARGAKLVINGNFDDMTVAAVKAFQSAHGLVVDAVVGPQTWKALA